MVRCSICNTNIKDYEPEVRVVDGIKKYYCTTHMNKFYFKCPYCGETINSKTPADYKHIVKFSSTDSGKLLCPKYWDEKGLNAIIVKSFNELKVNHNDEHKEQRRVENG